MGTHTGSCIYSDVTTSLDENVSFKDKKSSSENSGSDTYYFTE